MTNEITTMRDNVTRGAATRRALITIVALIALVCGLAADQARATGAPAAGWALSSQASPTNFSATQNNDCIAVHVCDRYELAATAAGSLPMDGSPITMSDTLPAGLTVQQIHLAWIGPGAVAAGIDANADFGAFFCDVTTVQCSPPFALRPDDRFEMIVDVTVDDPHAVGPLTNAGKVAGGGAPEVTATSQNRLSVAPAPFGPTDFSSYVAAPDGSPDTQAGSHPYELTTHIHLASVFRVGPEGFPNLTSVNDPKDLVVDLPLGFVGTALAAPQCTLVQLSSKSQGGGGSGGGCPADTTVGHVRSGPAALLSADSPIFNMVPEHGVAAEFGYVDLGGASHVLTARVVPGPGGYVLEVSATDIPEITIDDVVTTFYGNPNAKNQGGGAPVGMFINPSSCSGEPLVTTLHADSWLNPGRRRADGTPDLSDPNWVSIDSSSPPVTGCNKLQFSASLRAQPDTTVADSPSGVDVEIKVPQATEPDSLATPPLKKATVTLPPGFTVNPGSADGLAACSPAQIGLDSATAPTCPDASKIGSVQLTTPLLPGTLGGAVYLAAQNDNPFGSVLAGYIVVDDPVTGVVVKIPGKLTADPQTGQITGVFDNNPQFPFSDLKLHFFGGSRGTLATPESCGSFATTSTLTPWSAPDSGPSATPGDAFTISSGCTGGFAPSFSAGVVNPTAGGSSDFTLQVDRADGQQHIKSVTTVLAPGILANVGSVPLCSDADAAAGTCSAASQVGTTDVGAGPGAHPLHVAGKVFLTGPYKGGPYGLSIVTRAIAGPFDLGTVVVRAAISVDPIDAHATVVSDDVPNILDVKGNDGETDGFPLRIRSIDVDMNRPKFMVSPTSCAPMAIAGTLGSWEGTSASVSSRFQVGDCQALAVAPKLALSLTGKGQTTDDKHPGVHAVLTQTPGLANLKKVEVTLPLSLALDPDNAQALCEFADGSKVEPTCPKASIVGHVTAESPILDGPLTGPVYFVKNIRVDAKTGRQIRTLPKLVIPLTGPNGLRLNLTGLSSVPDNKHLVSTFDLIPDAPVSKFTLDIDGGKHGILVVSGANICKSTQKATQEATGQNGKVTDATVTIGTPCTLGVTASSHTSTALKLTVGGLGAGKVAVSGNAITKTSRTIASATSATLTAKLTRAARTALAHHRNVTVRLTVSFTPKGAKKAKIMHKTLTIHGASKSDKK